MRLRSVFLAGCVVLALPGLVTFGVSASGALAAWQAAQQAARGTKAAYSAMHASTLLMAEGSQLQAAALGAIPSADSLAKATAASDDALARTEDAMRDAGLPLDAVVGMRADLALARSRAESAVRQRSATHIPSERYRRVVESLDDEVSRIERSIILASPSVGVAMGLAQSAHELRVIAGRRSSLLSTWLSGQDLTPSQKDTLLAIDGSLAGAWDRLQREVRAANLPTALTERLSGSDSNFITLEDPWYRELVKIAVAGGERPLGYAQYRAWSCRALETLSPLRDALLAEARARGNLAIHAAWRKFLTFAGSALLSLALVSAAVLALLRSLVEPVRKMTATMTALAAGDTAADTTTASALREIGAMAAAVAVFRENVVSLRQREAELTETGQRLELALSNMAQGLCMFDAEHRLEIFNERFCAIYGIDRDRLRLGLTFGEVIQLSAAGGTHPRYVAEGTAPEEPDWRRWIRPGTVLQELEDGRTISIALSCLPSGGWVATYEDITERREAEARIAHMARHDALTGLPNRVLLREHMEQALARSRRGSSVAVLCLDLDGFKGVNDALGHPAGDALLHLVACRLRGATRETDLVARLGGDEFAVIQAGTQQPADAASLAERLVEVLRAPFDLHGHLVTIGTSIGIALVDRAEVTADELLRNADIALYRAKATGRGTYRFFEPGMDAELQRRRALEADLRRALAEEQFEIHYQPLFEARTESLVGFEALLRWRHPERGLVSPGEFIPLAEEIGLIQPVGAWVLARACADAAGWPEHVKVAVNLSPVQFTNDALVRTVEAALADSGLASRRLELEITESVLLQDNEATLRLLHRLRALGVSISMDDFGIGYSSLSYLHRFPFDKIKVDQSFVRNLERDESNVVIIRAMIGLGKALGMGVLAEGVETVEQLNVLREEGCDELQGYLLGRPQPVQHVPALIARLSAPATRSPTGPVLVTNAGERLAHDLSHIA
jgi:diguanylate cyclase (GGDEF)-like protein